MYHGSRRVLALAIAGVTAVLAQPAVAETLDKVQVTAQNSAGLDDLISSEQLQNLQANDLEDVFRQSPEVAVGGSLGVAQKIYVRGIEDTNLNVTIDGAVQSGYLFHHQGRVNIEPELLKQVEVQAGAGLATDGAGALGGAIRFTTKDPEDLLRDDERAGALVKLGYQSNSETFKTSGTVFGRVSDEVSLMASLTHQKGDEFEDGNGDVVPNTETDIDSGFVKLVANPTDNQRLSLSHEVRYDDGQRNLRSHFIAAGWNPETVQESHRKTTTLNYDIDPAGDALDIETTLYHTDSYITQLRDGSKDGAGVKSVGGDIRNTLRSGDHKLVFGGDYRRDTGYYINPETPVRDEKAQVTGLYVQDHYQATDKLMLTAGARYDYYRLVDTESQVLTSDGVSPNVGASYQLSDELILRASYAEALRGQKVKEAYLLGWAVNSPDLQEEEADNFELGLDYRSGNLTFETTAYVSNIENFVDRVTRQEINNSGDVKSKGFNARIGYDWENTRANLSYSYNRPEIDGKPLDDGDMSIGTAIGDTWVADVDHHLPQYNLHLGWIGSYVERLTDVPEGRAEKPGYAVHDIYATWLPTGSDDLSVTLTVRNLFDKQYLDHGSYGVSTSSGETIGLPESGRDIRLTLAGRF